LPFYTKPPGNALRGKSSRPYVLPPALMEKPSRRPYSRRLTGAPSVSGPGLVTLLWDELEAKAATAGVAWQVVSYAIGRELALTEHDGEQ
jgi:hypothetical protein